MKNIKLLTIVGAAAVCLSTSMKAEASFRQDNPCRVEVKVTSRLTAYGLNPNIDVVNPLSGTAYLHPHGGDDGHGHLQCQLKTKDQSGNETTGVMDVPLPGLHCHLEDDEGVLPLQNGYSTCEATHADDISCVLVCDSIHRSI